MLSRRVLCSSRDADWHDACCDDPAEAAMKKTSVAFAVLVGAGSLLGLLAARTPRATSSPVATRESIAVIDLSASEPVVESFREAAGDDGTALGPENVESLLVSSPEPGDSPSSPGRSRDLVRPPIPRYRAHPSRPFRSRVVEER
jgi:hypothetical protein